MIRDSGFFPPAELVLRMTPFVAREECFALKGGTAINFFVLDLPRLSVDIDLAYLPLESRDVSLKKISEALVRIAASIRKAHQELKVHESKAAENRRTVKLVVTDGRNQIKIEPNEVIRGAVFGSEERTVSKGVEEAFGMSSTMPVLSVADLYGGKICALLDRQHPRDMFDVKLLLENEGITPDIRRAFVVYLAGHDRPIHELIDPTKKDMRAVYESEFVGMTAKPVSYEDLDRARDRCISELNNELTDNERNFLVSLKECQPKWDLLGIEGVEKLPSVQWKLMNLKKMNPEKRNQYLKKLKERLGVS